MPFLTGYNDAWETPGWTAQNMAYPAPNTNPIMYPADVEMVTITGHFRDGDGGRANGWFEIDNGTTILRHALTKEMITPIRLRVEIKDGVFSVTVPATDATNLSSNDGTAWGYHIRIALDGRKFDEFQTVLLPKATPNLDVFDLLNGDTGPSGPVVIVGGGTP